MNPNSDSHPVLVDIYPWALACERQGSLVMEGVFRHAEYLSLEYQPAFAVVEGEHIPHAGIAILTAYLGKQIVALREASWDAVSGLLEALGCKVWVSLAIDFVCPLICRQTPFKKLTIAHDMLAADGEFGPTKEQDAKRGLQWNDVFAYISTTTLHEVSIHELVYSRPCKFIKYGCFHDYLELPPITGVRHSDISLSVSSIFPRKNILRVFEMAKELRTTHYHIGTRYQSPSPRIWEEMIVDGFRYMGAVPDSTLKSMYSRATRFISMSSAEGFNMPPMEAIICGVPVIYLSDTLINREIYGEIPGVAFCSLSATVRDVITSMLPLPLTNEHREYVFSKYKRDNVVANLEKYVATLVAN